MHVMDGQTDGLHHLMQRPREGPHKNNRYCSRGNSGLVESLDQK